MSPPATKQPSNHELGEKVDAEIPNDYISLRVSCKHEQINELIQELLVDVPRYIIYPHGGQSGNNPHVHVCIAGDYEHKDVERFRKRCRKFGRGNGKLMAKSMHNGVCSFASYVKHESGTPILKGFEQSWFDEQPAFKKNGIGHYMAKPVKRVNEDTFYQITYANMEKVTLRYRAQNGISSTQLEDTLEHMHSNGWRLNIAVLRGGIPSSIFEQFTKSCENGTVWSSARFARLKKDESWRMSF